MQANCDNLRRMSEEDVLRAKARTQDEYVQCKARLSLLESEGRHNAELLDRVCAFLRSGGKQGPFRTGGLEEVLSEKLIALMHDLHDTSHRREELRGVLVNMGLDLKE
jgi:hypothetical protein